MKGYPTLGLVLVILSEDAKILVMSGTHGTENEVSTLSELDTNIIHLAVSQTEELRLKLYQRTNTYQRLS